MRPLSQLPQGTERILGLIESCRSELESMLGSGPQPELIRSNINILLSPWLAEKRHACKLLEGTLSLARSGHVIMVFEQGDFIAPEIALLHDAQPQAEWSLSSDFAVRIGRVASEVLSAKSSWHQYGQLQNILFILLLAELGKNEPQIAPRVFSAKYGETLIVEGSEGKEVFTMVQGSADVFVAGVKVGAVIQDEIFGALAALSETKRTATVVANDECLIMELPRERFIDLINARPATILKLVQDMARSIVSLNEKVVQLSKGQGR